MITALKLIPCPEPSAHSRPQRATIGQGKQVQTRDEAMAMRETDGEAVGSEVLKPCHEHLSDRQPQEGKMRCFSSRKVRR